MAAFINTMASKRYKDYRLYAFITLNHILHSLNVSLDQEGALDKIGPLLESQPGVSKTDIMHEIKSNHNMTNKVLDHLLGDGLVTVDASGGGYSIKITAAGVSYLKQYSGFYRSFFAAELKDHYRYKGAPHWAGRRDGA